MNSSLLPVLLIHVGKKKDDPDSPSYVPTIFGSKAGQKERSSQRRYEAVKRRRERKDEAERRESMQQAPETSPDVPGGGDQW